MSSETLDAAFREERAEPTGYLGARTLTSYRFGLRSTADLFTVLSAVSITLFAAAEQSTAIILSFVVFGLFGTFIARRFGRTATRIFLLTYGFGVVAAVAVYLYYLSRYGVPYWEYGSDDLGYERYAAEFARSYGMFDYGSIRGNIVTADHNSVGYIYLVGLLYKWGNLVGYSHTMIPRLFNVLCLGLLAVGVYVLSLRLLLQKRTAIGAALFTGLMPLMVYNSVQTFREAFVALLLTWMVVWWTPDQRNRNHRSIFLATTFTLVAVVVLIDFRIGQAFAGGIIALTAFFTTARRGSLGALARWPIVATLLVGAFLGVQILIVRYYFFFVSQINPYLVYHVETTGGGLSTTVFTTPGLAGFALRAVYLLISPLPLPTTELDLGWYRSNTLVQLFYLPFFFIGVPIAMRDKARRLVVLAVVLLFSAVAFITFQERQIVQYYPFAIVIAAIGYESRRHRRKYYFSATVVLLIGLGVTYYSLKGLG